MGFALMRLNAFLITNQCLKIEYVFFFYELFLFKHEISEKNEMHLQLNDYAQFYSSR